MKLLPIAVLISGNGSNLQALIDAIQSGILHAEIKVVISNKPDAYGLERAKKAGIQAEVFSFAKFKREGKGIREEYDAQLATFLKQFGVSLIVLAGWMHIVSPSFLEQFPQRVINLHPALLPSFPGVDAIKQAWEYGVRCTGVTVHVVDSGVDTGPIILQESLKILSSDTLHTLSERVRALEHLLLPRAVELFAQDKVVVQGRKVVLV
ncbi:MAG: phosphoribosylglycinamide formyltransferase [bacterium]